jgi:hypothetical protein
LKVITFGFVGFILLFRLLPVMWPGGGDYHAEPTVTGLTVGVIC